MSDASRDEGLLKRLGRRIAGVFTLLYRIAFVASLLIGLLLAWLLLSGGPPIKVEDNVALVIAPGQALVERRDVDPLEAILQQWSGAPPQQTAVSELVTAIDRAAEDPRIRLLVLKLDDMLSAGAAAIDEVGLALERFRAAGKAVHVWSDLYTQTQYALAVHADELSLDPLGAIWLEGYAVYPNYFAELFDRLGIEVSVFRVGTFKSAVEPFIRRDMSAAARQANAHWLGDLWQSYRERIDGRRPGLGEALPAYIESLPGRLEAAGGDMARVQQEAGLVDRLESLEAFRARIGEVVGMEEERHASFRQIHFARYLRATDGEAKRAESAVVAQLTVQGVIVDGQGDIGSTGGEALAAELAALQRDDAVRAVVLRIDSPGGSVLASERIRRAVRALREAGKPVVASMASQAASGGYWVAMGCDAIIAHPASITGSIGVFGLWLSVDDGLSKLGVYTDGVGTSPLAAALRPDRPLAEPARRILQSGVEHAYATFIEGVAEARGMPESAVDAVAQGRVWTGRQALSHGLVDALGGIETAAQRAAELAGLEEGSWRLRQAAPEATGLGGMLQKLSGRVLSLVDGRFLEGALSAWLGSAVATGDGAALLLRHWPADAHGRVAYCGNCRVAAPATAMPLGARR